MKGMQQGSIMRKQGQEMMILARDRGKEKAGQHHTVRENL
jgi:hypothetical protein